MNVIICFHCEPDEFYPEVGSPPEWIGLGIAFDLVQLLRSEGADQLRILWQFRADPQIEMLHNGSDWGFTYFKSQITEAKANGDEVGVHIHPYRLQESTSTFVQDYVDFDWNMYCIDMAVESFHRVFGHPPESVSIGENVISTTLINYFRGKGIKYDLSIQCGNQKEFPKVLGGYIGVKPKYTNVPKDPYCPAMDDLLKVDAEGQGFLTFPIHSFRHPFQLPTWKKLLRTAIFKPNFQLLKPSLAMAPKPFQGMVKEALKAEIGCMVIDTRSHIFKDSLKFEHAKNNLKYLLSLNGKSLSLITPGKYVKS